MKPPRSRDDLAHGARPAVALGSHSLSRARVAHRDEGVLRRDEERVPEHAEGDQEELDRGEDAHARTSSARAGMLKRSSPGGSTRIMCLPATLSDVHAPLPGVCSNPMDRKGSSGRKHSDGGGQPSYMRSASRACSAPESAGSRIERVRICAECLAGLRGGRQVVAEHYSMPRRKPGRCTRHVRAAGRPRGRRHARTSARATAMFEGSSAAARPSASRACSSRPRAARASPASAHAPGRSSLPASASGRRGGECDVAAAQQAVAERDELIGIAAGRGELVTHDALEIAAASARRSRRRAPRCATARRDARAAPARSRRPARAPARARRPARRGVRSSSASQMRPRRTWYADSPAYAHSASSSAVSASSGSSARRSATARLKREAASNGVSSIARASAGTASSNRSLRSRRSPSRRYGSAVVIASNVAASS